MKVILTCLLSLCQGSMSQTFVCHSTLSIRCNYKYFYPRMVNLGCLQIVFDISLTPFVLLVTRLKVKVEDDLYIHSVMI